MAEKSAQNIITGIEKSKEIPLKKYCTESESSM
jgi:NAD-dependent DNA ligase